MSDIVRMKYLGNVFILQVIVYDKASDVVVKGLHAAGEAACNCHGANRLGANSILDIVVFGGAIGANISKIAKPGDSLPTLQDVNIFLFFLAKYGTIFIFHR